MRIALQLGRKLPIAPKSQPLTILTRCNSLIGQRTYRTTSTRYSPANKMETIKSTIAENMGGIFGDNAHKMAAPEHQFDIDKDVPDLSGKVALVTGGSQGIGYAASFVMLRAGLEKIFILATDQKVFDGALNDVKEKLGAPIAQKMVWLQCDMSDLPAVTKAAQTVRDSTDRLDILCLNAARGIMTYQVTDYGVDRHMAVNHFGHVTLCSHLLPLLKKTAESGTVRIQVQSSNAHQQPGKDVMKQFSSLDELNQDLGPNAQYGRSKLAQLLYARWLNKHLTKSHPNILVNATHPGFVETKMSSEDIHEPYPIMGYAMSVGMTPFKKDQWMGSVSTLYAATATKNSGQYICPPAIPEPGSEEAQNEELGEQLMKLTTEVVKQKFGAQSVEKGCPLKAY